MGIEIPFIPCPQHILCSSITSRLYSLMPAIKRCVIFFMCKVIVCEWVNILFDAVLSRWWWIPSSWRGELGNCPIRWEHTTCKVIQTEQPYGPPWLLRVLTHINILHRYTIHPCIPVVMDRLGKYFAGISNIQDCCNFSRNLLCQPADPDTKERENEE